MEESIVQQFFGEVFVERVLLIEIVEQGDVQTGRRSDTVANTA
jgi:hypothetical protein